MQNPGLGEVTFGSQYSLILYFSSLEDENLCSETFLFTRGREPLFRDMFGVTGVTRRAL